MTPRSRRRTGLLIRVLTLPCPFLASAVSEHHIAENLFFFFNDPAPPEFHPLPLHAALPIWTPRHDVIAFFNGGRNEQKFDSPLERLGLRSDKEYLIFDYWANALRSPFQGSLILTVPA